MIRQSFTWWSFTGRGVDDMTLLKEAKKIGFHGVEFLPKELWPVAADLGLALPAIGGHGPIPEGLNDPANHGRIRDAIARKLELAHHHKIGMLIVFAGNRRPGVSDDQAAEITAGALKKLAPLAEAAGVDLCLELLNSKYTHVGYQADSTAWGVNVCNFVASPRVKLLYDIFHMQIMEGDLIRTIQANHASIGHYHTAGNPGRSELDDQQEINYRGVFKAVANTGYDGWIGHEYVPTREILPGLRQAFELTAGQI